MAQLDVDEINVNINSYGGEVAEGLAIFNALKRHKAKINTRCDGFACSIASVIFMAGDKRVMNDASLLMIHNAWTYASGDANELRKQADDLDLITDQSKKIYLSKVSISEDELAQLMDEETFIDSDAAIEMGFATDVANAHGILSIRHLPMRRSQLLQLMNQVLKSKIQKTMSLKNLKMMPTKILMILRPLVKNPKMKPTAKLIRMTDPTAMMVLVPIVPMIRKLAKRMSQIQTILTISKMVAKAKIQTTKKMMKFRNNTQTFSR